MDAWPKIKSLHKEFCEDGTQTKFRKISLILLIPIFLPFWEWDMPPKGKKRHAFPKFFLGILDKSYSTVKGENMLAHRLIFPLLEERQEKVSQ